MHPEVTVHLAQRKLADEHAWAERQRRARIARGDPAPDAIVFDEPVEHLSFAARVRALLDTLRGGGDVPAPAGA